MAYRARRGRKVGREKVEQYAPLSYPMLQSPAWRSLGGSAAKVFLELRCRFHGHNNGKLALSLEEAARLLHMGKATALAAFAELVEKGFVVCTRKGQWYGRLASTWAVTDKGVDGNPPTNAWRQWKPGPVLKPNRKTKRGSRAEPSHYATDRFQDPAPVYGSASEPVSGLGAPGIGSATDR
jgi:hypothetical protein